MMTMTMEAIEEEVLRLEPQQRISLLQSIVVKQKMRTPSANYFIEDAEKWQQSVLRRSAEIKCGDVLPLDEEHFLNNLDAL